jgi:lambda family phage tail tape measure protein
MAGDKVGEAYVELRYQLDQLQRDMASARQLIARQAQDLNRDVASRTSGMFGDAQAQAQGLGATMGLLRASIVGAFAAQAVSAIAGFTREVATAATTVGLLQARLNETLGAGSFGEVANLANRLGVELGVAADATARFGLAGQDIGLTRDQVVQLTETVVKLGRIGGSSANEMNAGMLQLGQALASGRFQGDELRSVLENMPALARTLATELGVGIGELRRMGTEGNLTSQVVTTALLGAAGRVNEAFAKLPETLEQSEARWRNASQMLFAALDRSLHASSIYQWFDRFRTGLAQGLAVDFGGGDPDTRVKVLEERLATLRSGNLMGENSGLIAGVEQQLEDERRLSRELRQLQDGREATRSGAQGPSQWSLYPVPTLDDAKALKGYLDDAASDRERAAREAETAREREQRDAERALADKQQLDRERFDWDAKNIDREIEIEEKRQNARDEALERLGKDNNERNRLNLEAWQAEQDRLKELDPAGYYQRTGDEELAPVYSAAAGTRKALAELGDASQQYGQIMQDAIGGAAEQAARGLTQLALTSKLSVKSILADVAELALNQIFRMAIQSGLGLAGNALFGAPGTTPGMMAGGGQAGRAGFARGGAFSQGEVIPLARGAVLKAATTIPLRRGAALMAESGPEAVMPLGRDSKGRLGVLGAGGGGGGMKVEIYDQRGGGAPPVQTQMTNGPDGIEVLKVFVQDTVQQTIGGGRADKAFRERFGIAPRARR